MRGVLRGARRFRLRFNSVVNVVIVVLGWLAATNVAVALAALAAATLVVLVARRRRAKKAKIA